MRYSKSICYLILSRIPYKISLFENDGFLIVLLTKTWVPVSQTLRAYIMFTYFGFKETNNNWNIGVLWRILYWNIVIFMSFLILNGKLWMFSCVNRDFALPLEGGGKVWKDSFNRVLVEIVFALFFFLPKKGFFVLIPRGLE